MKKYYIAAGNLRYRTGLTVVENNKFYKLNGDDLESAIKNSMDEIAESVISNNRLTVLQIGIPQIIEKSEKVIETGNHEQREVVKKWHEVVFSARVSTNWTPESPNYREWEETYNVRIYEFDM